MHFIYLILLVVGLDPLIADPFLVQKPVYQDYGLQTIKDVRSGLFWTRCSAGMEGHSRLCVGLARAMDWHTARDYCQQLQSDKRKWRLPSRKEIKTLLDVDRVKPPFIDLRYFTISNRGQYWTRDHSVETTGVHFYYINFHDGLQYSTLPKKQMFTQCVSDMLR